MSSFVAVADVFRRRRPEHQLQTKTTATPRPKEAPSPRGFEESRNRKNPRRHIGRGRTPNFFGHGSKSHAGKPDSQDKNPSTASPQTRNLSNRNNPPAPESYLGEAPSSRLHKKNLHETKRAPPQRSTTAPSTRPSRTPRRRWRRRRRDGDRVGGPYSTAAPSPPPRRRHLETLT